MRPAGEVCALDASNFEKTIEETPLVFVDFWATWCAPCTQFADVYAKVALEHQAITFASVDIEKAPELAEMFEIRSVPYLMVFKQGIAIYSDSGACPPSVLNELVAQALAVDVRGIREQLDADESA
jgi:thioredoxin 1